MEITDLLKILGTTAGAVNPYAAVAQLGLGAYQAFTANKALKGLQRQAVPSYGITPEQTRSYNRAEEMSNTGFTGAERASANQGLARSGNQAYRRALTMSGGSTARGIQGALGAMNLQGQNQLATSDAMLRRRNVQYADQVGRGITDQRNRETARAYNYRMMLEQNLGTAKKVGLENIVNSMAYIGAPKGFKGMFGSQGGQEGMGPQGGNQYNQESPPTGYTQPNNPYQGGFNLPPSQNLYTWPE